MKQMLRMGGLPSVPPDTWVGTVWTVFYESVVEQPP